MATTTLHEPAAPLPGTLDELSRAVLSSHPAHIAVLDRDGKIIATNEAWDQFARANDPRVARDGAPDAPPAAPDPTRAICPNGVGCNYLDVCGGAHGEDAEGAGAAGEGIRSVLAGRQELFQMEYPCHAPGEERWFLLTVTPLKHAAGGAVVSHLNITARKRDEQALRERTLELAALARQLRKSNEELDQFAYIASHDLRAPLRGIANLSQWIEEDLADRVTDDARKMLDLLRGRVTRMEALIDGVLEYSRIGRVAVRPERVDVTKLLGESVDLLAPPAGARVNIPDDVPPLLADRLRLQQVFMNLIGNAFKHHPDPARCVVNVTWREAGDYVQFAVSDNGPGIEVQYHEKIFQIFQTLVARDKQEAAGVGLSLVKKIVESQGGSIRVESEPGRGATFAFTWPRRARGA